ncbi:MAG: hypothetical protein ACE5PM_03470, partial [Candidatus Hydrothermarchaeales archaeon]
KRALPSVGPLHPNYFIRGALNIYDKRNNIGRNGEVHYNRVGDVIYHPPSYTSSDVGESQEEDS